MPLATRRVARFARAWTRGPLPTEEAETTLDREGTAVPATLLRPRGVRAPLPGWVVLHGIARAGRAHQQLGRFTRALVSTGAVAVVPDVPEWRALTLAPDVATPTVVAGLRGLRDSGWVLDRPVGVIGFSFGAPHAIASAGDPRLVGEVSGAVGFGGYCVLESTFRFMMVGSVDGGAPRRAPDPYGRWIVTSNYLTAVPGHDDAGDVAGALRKLAAFSSDGGATPTGGVYDALLAGLRGRIAAERRTLFDMFAPPTGTRPDDRAAREMADLIAGAARRTDPLVDPVERLGDVPCPVHIVHGRYDRLISCSEAPKIRACLPTDTWSRVTITRLFGHSSRDSFPVLSALHEVPRFARALGGVLGVV